jgi:hypothetical protein
VGRACSIYGRDEKYIKKFDGKPQGKRPDAAGKII